MELAGYTSLAIAIIILMLKPGPVMITCMSLSMEGKWRSILSFWTGYLVVRTFSYFLFLTTLTVLPTGFGVVFIFIKAIAAILFITLGFKGLLANMADAQSSSQGLKKKISGDNLIHNFFTGGALQLSNPYDYVFILTVIPALMGTTEFSLLDITYINILVIIIDIVVNAAYILPILYFRKMFPTAVLRKIKIAASCLMILIGLFIFSTVFFRSGLEESQLLSMITVSEGA